MRAPATSSHHTVPTLFAIILAFGLLPSLGGQSVAAADEAAVGAEEAPLLASLMSSGGGHISTAVALEDDPEPVVGSFTVDGLTYAIIGEGEVVLVSVDSDGAALAAGSSGAGEGPLADSDGAPSGEGSGSGAPPRSVAEQVPSGATSPQPSPEGASSDGVEDEGAFDPVVLEVPESVEYGGTTYSVVAIGPRAFAGCDADAVTIPATVESVDELAFRGSAIKAIEVADGNPIYSSYDGMLFDADMTSLLLIPEGKQGAARIPKAAEVVPADAFSHCASVTAIEADAGSAAFSSRNGCLYDASGEALVASPPAIDALSGAAAPRGIDRGSFNATQDGVVYHYRADDLAELISQGTSLSDDRMNEFELDEGLVWREVVSFPGRYPYTAASPTRHLLGWSTKPSGGTLIKPGTRAGSTWNVYAVFGPKVTWDANGGEAPVASSPAWVDEAIASPVPTREGYRCLGWFTAPEGGELACEPGGQTPPVSADLTLHAQWEALGAPIPISYDPGSEPGGGEAGSWPEGAEPPLALPPDAGLVALPEPVRAGYVLAGWSVKGQPGADLLSRGEGGAWTIDSSKLPDYADEEGAVALVARWTAKVEVEAPLEATFLYDLARDGAAESSASKDAWSGGAEGASLLRNRSAVPVRVSGMQSVAAEGASVLLGPGGSTLAEAAAGGPKVLSVFPTTDPATGTRADAEGPATDGEGDDLAHKVDLALGSTLLDDAFASSPDGSPDAGRRAAWTVPAAAPGMNGVPVPGSLKLGFRLNLGGSTGATVDRSALLAATGGDATGTAKVPIAGLSYCFALEGISAPPPTGDTGDPFYIDNRGVPLGVGEDGVYGTQDILDAALDLAKHADRPEESVYYELYRAFMGNQGVVSFDWSTRESTFQEGPFFKLRIGSELHEVRVLGICQDRLAAPYEDESGASINMAGLTFGWKVGYIARLIHPNDGTPINWSTCEARTYLNGTFRSSLPLELRRGNGIKAVVKIQNGTTGKVDKVDETRDSIFIPSAYEIYGMTINTGTWGNGGPINPMESVDNSFQYQYFALGGIGSPNVQASLSPLPQGLHGSYWCRSSFVVEKADSTKLGQNLVIGVNMDGSMNIPWSLNLPDAQLLPCFAI